ncbi:MAG: PDZ domain-containing protein [Lachnospiraceae bacterium]|nr:PDZ domain-containing protein [Lachnospiraceae bacterium]MBP3579043.1 PDZ domain-containing protein [Lachnospiraceae bacterium]
MTEELKEKQSEEYQFINEKIVPKRKKKWLKRLGTVGFVVCMAVIFGVVAHAAYLLSGDSLKKLLGVEDKRQEVELPKPTAPVRITLSPTPKPEKATETPTPETTAEPTTPVSLTVIPTKTPTQGAEETPEPTDVPEVTLEPTKDAEPTPDAEATPGGVPTPGLTDAPEPTNVPEVTPDAELTPEPTPIDTYLQIYDAIRKVAEEVSDAFVTVEAIEQGVDWFQEVYEKRTRTTGLVLGNDGVDLLILVGTEQFTGANAIDVFFGEAVIPGRIYSMDRDYGLAVIAVSLNNIPAELLEQITMGLFAEAGEIVTGTPVIALGAPNGYEGSMEFGMITSLGGTVPVTDGEVSYFTTNITEYPQGYGFVVNLEGKILGLITHNHKANPSDGIFTAISLDSIRGVIVKLLNNAESAYFGIKGQDIPKNLKQEYGLENGVYVREVENASPALAAGIKAGDILISVGGEAVDGIRGFSDLILERSIREIVQVKLLRKAEDGLREMMIEVSLTGKK